MRTTRSSRSGFDEFGLHLKDFLLRRTAEIAGVAMLVFAVVMTLALITWSVQDPSINHATSGPVRNWLGRPGALIADLAMQLFGVASIAMIGPIALSGFRLFSGRQGRLGKSRFVFWFIGAIAACACAAAMPRTDAWPLPTGLGGVAGDAVFNLLQNGLGLGGSAMRALFGLAFGALAFFSLAFASGFFGRRDKADTHQPDTKNRRPVKAEDFDDDDRAGDPGFGIVSLGAIFHALLSLRGALARRMPGRSASSGPGLLSRFALKLRDRDDDPLEAMRRRGAMGRTEPDFGTYPLRPPLDLPDEETASQQGQPQQQNRVAPRAPAPKPGKRAASEAQTSMLDNGDYRLPPLSLLAEHKRIVQTQMSTEALEQNARLLESVLEDFGVRGEIINVRPGPVVTLYELEPAPGIKSSRVIGLADDIARSMSAVSARVAVVQGRNAIGIELPNQKRETVWLRELLSSQDFEKSKLKLALCLGKTIGGEPVITELARMPHLLVAGTTGSGKSVAINTMILSLLYRLTPQECRLIMVDPKMLELSVYDGIPHLLTPVVTDPKKAVVALKWAVREMEERYKKMSKLGVRNIDGFNARVGEAKSRGEIITRTVQTGFDRETGEAIYEEEVMDLEPLPYIVVIVDEMADLMMVAGKDIEGAIQRLAQMARAAGIHVILATQRPSVDVITGTIKANFPTRISFQVTSKIDSRTILGEQGAEQLLGQGDMLYMAGGGRIARVHGPFVSDDEVEKVVAHLKAQARPQYLEAVLQDDGPAEDEDGGGAIMDQGAFGAASGDLYDQAVALVLRDRKASTSYIQRRLQIGYNRAASLMERMENENIVGPANHAGKREILLESPPGRHDTGYDD
jgi:S-DNA-T family DNA segregation ATPase FtsK/SpoIIIE